MKNKINLVTFSNTGIVRERNEDIVFVNSQNHLFGVCDGMGGLKYGKKAAEIVGEYFQSYNLIEKSVEQEMQFSEEEIIKDIICDIDYKIGFQNYPWYTRYGCTLCGVWIINDLEAIIFNVGDSRCYIYRDNFWEGELLTKDHNQASEIYNKGAKAANHDIESGKHILTKFIGNFEDNEPEICRVKYHVGDRFLICTDGLYNEVQKKEMDEIMYNKSCRNIMEIGSDLMTKAIVAGGKDNISLVLIDFME